jgi:uncharacterized protein involved in exopolysaccharide biosynthesis
MDASAVRVEERALGSWRALIVVSLLRAWRWLAAAALAGGAIGVAIGLLLPSWHDTTVQLALAPVDDPTTPALTGSVESAGVELPLLAAILQSRVVADEAVSRLDLGRVYRTSSVEAARRELTRHLRITADKKANTVTVWVEDREAPRARELAHVLAEASVRESGAVWTARSRQHRRRLEERLAEVGRTLASAEEALRQFREKNRVVDLDAQVKASVAEAAAIEHVSIEKRLALHYARGYAARDSPEVKRAEREAAGAGGALAKLVHGRRSSSAAGRASGPLLALDDLPAIEQEHDRLRREVDVNASGYALLAKQVEQLRAVEARPVGHAEVIDPPVVSLRRSRPARGMLALEGAMVGLLLAALATLGRAWRRSGGLRSISM